MEFINQTGVFFFPLLLCSVLATFISIERYFALRKTVVFPNGFLDDVLSGNVNSVTYSKASLAGRLLDFFNTNSHAKDEKMLKAFVQLEIGRLERGLFILEVVDRFAFNFCYRIIVHNKIYSSLTFTKCSLKFENISSIRNFPSYRSSRYHNWAHEQSSTSWASLSPLKISIRGTRTQLIPN